MSNLLKMMNTASVSESLRPLALLSAGKTGADIERLVREVRAQCRRRAIPLTWNVLEEVLRQDDASLSDEVRHRIAVHEIGHALSYEMTGLGQVVSVRLHASGGKTEILLNRDRLQFAGGIGGNLTCILGGHAAETVVFGRRWWVRGAARIAIWGKQRCSRWNLKPLWASGVMRRSFIVCRPIRARLCFTTAGWQIGSRNGSKMPSGRQSSFSNRIAS